MSYRSAFKKSRVGLLPVALYANFATLQFSFPFSHSGFTIWISQTVYTVTSEHIRLFYFLVFLFLHCFSCRFRAVD